MTSRGLDRASPSSTLLDGALHHNLLPSMSEKPFADMSLEEVFDVEQKHSANLGRTVASADGLKRRKAAMQPTLQSGARQLKRRKATTSR